MPLKVAIIGAGASGLSSAYHLSRDPDKFCPVVFDKSREVGGLWNYSDDTETDEYGLPSYASVYKTLKINLPKETVGFPYLEFPSDLPSFLGHTDMKKYLNEFADKFDLKKYVKFQTLVTNVKPADPSDKLTSWLVSYQQLPSKQIHTLVFDSVFVCNGMSNIPKIVKVPGKEKFTGQIIHSMYLRDPKDFAGKTIVIIGGSFSAFDLIFELAPEAHKVYVASRGPQMAFKMPDNVKQTASVREILPNGVILENGECRECDVIFLATGFLYSTGFLDEQCRIENKENRLSPLYKHVYNIRYPRLCFVGLLKRCYHFRFNDLQAQHACAVLRGDVKLPSEAEMLRDEEEDYQKRVVSLGLWSGLTHDLFTEKGVDRGAWDYFDLLAKEAKTKTLSNVLKKLFEHIVPVYGFHFDTLKKRNYRLINDEEFEETMAEK